MARASKTPEQFAAEMAQVAPDVELLTPYVNAREKIPCRCRTCGGEWMGTPNHLLRGTGCPDCHTLKRVEPQEFADRVAQLFPTVELVTPYVNGRTRLQLRCTACGHEWDALPRGLTQGRGCPACAAKRP